MELVLDTSPVNPRRMHPSLVRDKIFGFIGREAASGREFVAAASIRKYMGWQSVSSAISPLSSLRVLGLVDRYLINGSYHRPIWRMTSKGLEIYRAQCAAEAEVVAVSPVKRKPRRTGSPKRVPHKPTAAHKKPSRQQRREIERQREHQVTA
jgi:hypothetical protein